MVQQWEYKKVLIHEDKTELELNALGSAGWEVIQLEPTYGGEMLIGLLKRLIEEGGSK